MPGWPGVTGYKNINPTLEKYFKWAKMFASGGSWEQQVAKFSKFSQPTKPWPGRAVGSAVSCLPSRSAKVGCWKVGHNCVYNYVQYTHTCAQDTPATPDLQMQFFIKYYWLSVCL